MCLPDCRARRPNCQGERPIRLFQAINLSLAIACVCCGDLWGADGIDFSNRDAIEGAPSANGTVTLAWSDAGDGLFELQQATEGGFADPVVRYEGPDAGSVVSGLPEGVHFFRVRRSGGDWSPAVAVRVEFVPRRKLFTLLGLGGVVVLATVAAIVAGHLSTRREGGVP